MKKKMFKGLGLSLCAMLLLAGCSCKKEEAPDTTANINNPTGEIVSGLREDVTSITLKEIYDELKAVNGNEVAANKLLDIIADLVLTGDWEDRYEAKAQEKLQKFVDDEAYKVDGVFNEELLVKTLKAQLYNIGTCADQTYGPIYDQDGKIEKYLNCDYSDYVAKALNVEIITELLNEKYIYDKVMVDKENILTTKKARLVEYVSISYSGDEEEDEVIEHIAQAVTELAAENSTKKLTDIADAWTNKKIEELLEEKAKINTKEDANGSIMKDFTDGYTRSVDEGERVKKQEIYASSNYDKLVITSDSKDILNSTLVERILSDNVLSTNARKTILINGSYYLIAPWAGDKVTSTDIRIKDASNSKYYIVKVDVINEDDLEDDSKEAKALVYEAVKVLATNTTLVSDSVNYYLEKYKDKIGVYDEEIYNYLKTQYSDIFVD